jgi:hypothetical protein
MANPLIVAWVQNAIEHEPAVVDAIEYFDKAELQPYETSLLVASGLTRSGQGYIARWTGRELVILPLTQDEQANFGLSDFDMRTIMHHLPVTGEIPLMQSIGLSDLQINQAEKHDPKSYLTGTVRYSFDDENAVPLQACALRIEYCSTEIALPVYQFWYPSGALIPPEGEFNFSFNPIPGPHPTNPTAAIAVFLRLLVADNFHNLDGSKCISNLTGAIIQLA